MDGDPLSEFINSVDWVFIYDSANGMTSAQRWVLILLLRERIWMTELMLLTPSRVSLIGL
jgi:hypothetical protein